MTTPVDPSRLAGILAKLDFPIEEGDALVLVERRPAAVLWASDEALARFGATDASALAGQLFGDDDAATAFAARLARLSDAAPYRLERVVLAGHATPLVMACHPVEDAARSLALLHVRSGAAAAAAPLLPVRMIPPGPPGPDTTGAQPVTRILWETDAAGILTWIGAEARLLGAAAPRVGDDLPARLRDIDAALAARIAAAAEQGGSVGLVRFTWPADGARAAVTVEAGCTGGRGGVLGLRGFFAVHGAAEVPVAGDATEAGPDEAIAPAVIVTPAVEAEPALATAVEAPGLDDVAAREPGSPHATPAPPSSGASGNIVHFPIMRLGPVPANFVPALRPAPIPHPVTPGSAEYSAPQWSEAPSAGSADEDTSALSASERDAFEHIRRVLGTRPFTPERPETPAATALPDRTDAGSRDLTAPLAAEVVAFDMAETPETPTILPVEAVVHLLEPDAAAWAPEVLDLVTDGHLRLDDAGLVLALSPKAARLLGIEVGEAPGRLFASFLFEGQAPGWQALTAAATGPEAQPQGPSPLRLRTGTGQPLAVLARLGRSAGTLVCALTLDRPTPVPANDTAEAARREAERTSALKSEFLAKVSHEIRTPLNAILGFAEVIRDERLGPVGNARYLEYMRDIHASGTHVMSLVNDLLDLSRIEAGRMDLNLQAVDANAVVLACVNTLQTQAHRERVIVRLSLTPRLPPTLADERSLRQIALNLLSNAIKFNEPGGQVIVSTALAGPDSVAIRIRDTGIGMSDDEIAAAMEPFRQLSTVNRTGSGLGLPLTKALVEANCASMAIKSTRGEGTLVEVTFPVVEPDSVSLPAE